MLLCTIIHFILMRTDCVADVAETLGNTGEFLGDSVDTDLSEALQVLVASDHGLPILRRPEQTPVPTAHIPKLLFQTFNVKEQIPPKIGAMLEAWRRLNSDYAYELHDGKDMRHLIKEFFDPTFLQIFDAVGQYQQKADLWRLCVLFLRGGVYVDADYAPLSALADILPVSAQFAAALCAPLVVDAMQPPANCYSRPEALKRMQNGFIATVPGHPILLLALQRLRWNFYRQEDQHYLLALGPALLYEAYATLYNDVFAHILRGRRVHGLLTAVDVAPILIGEMQRRRGKVFLLLDADGMIASLEGDGGVLPHMQHKYDGWDEGVGIFRNDANNNRSRVSSGSCLLRFR